MKNLNIKQTVISTSRMERGKQLLTSNLHDTLDKLQTWSHQPDCPSFYECFVIHGLRIQKLEPRNVLCTWKVPARHTDASGVLHAGVIATIVDDVGAVASLSDNQPTKVSVDMNITYISTAKVDDEIEIHARVLGHKGDLSLTNVSLRNKATGALIAEGRHSLYGRRTSKL